MKVCRCSILWGVCTKMYSISVSTYRRNNQKLWIGKYSDELVGFEDAWKGNAQKHMPGWSEDLIGYGNISLALDAIDESSFETCFSIN